MSAPDQTPPDSTTATVPDPQQSPPVPAPPDEQSDPYAQAVDAVIPSGAPSSPPPTDPSADPYADAVGQIMSARKAVLSSSLVKGQDTPVERQAKVVALSDKLNLPPDVVNQSYDALTRQDALQGIDNQKLLDQHPELAKWLVEPGNAGLAQGDMPQLQHMDTMAQALTGAYNPGGILPPGYMFSATGNGTIRGPLHEDGSPPVVYKGLDDLRSALEGQELTAEQQQQALQAHEQVLEQGFLPPALAAGLQGSVGASTASVLTAANWWDRLMGGKGEATIGGADPSALRQFSTEGEAASEQAEPGFEGSVQRMAGEFAGDAPLYLAGGELAKVAEMGPTLLNLKEAAQLYGMAPSVGGLLDIVPALRALKATAALSPVPNSTYLQAAWKNAIAFSPLAARSGINTGDEHGAGYGTLDFLINAFGPGAAGHFGIAGDLAKEGTAAASGGLPVIVGRLLGHSLAQGGAMAGTELVNAMHEVATGVDPDALKGENLIPRLAKAGAMGSLLSSAFALPGAVGELTMRRQIAANTAMREADTDASLVEAYQASATMGRNEQHGRDLLKSLIPDGQTKRYMQSDDLEGVAKQVGMTPEELATALNAADEYKQAKATGKVMHISTDDLVVAAAKMKDPEKITALLAARRSRPDGTNVNESLQFYKEAPDEITAMHAQMAADITNAAKGVQESDPIYRDVMSQVAESGRPQQEARDDARLMAARFNTMAHRWNTEDGGAVARGAQMMDPMDEYQKYKLKIQREQPGAQPHDVLDNALDRIRSGKQPTATQAYGPSLHEFLAKRGVKGEGLPESIADPNGHALDVAAQRAYESGYIADEKPETLRGAINEESSGAKVYSEANRNADVAPAHELLNEIQSTLKAKGIDIGASNAEIKAALAGTAQPAIAKFSQSERGSIEFNAQRHFLITLTGKADLSTVLHESGHFWLETMGDFANRDGAPQQLKDDYAKVLDYLGVKDRSEIEVKHHEKFAQAIEQYLMEGHSPSPELRGTFQRFRLWLTEIYKHVKSLVTLTPEVKGVFDRMLATDDAIKSVQSDLGVSTLFKDEAAFGQGPEKWKSYLQSITDARNQADARVFNQAMRVLRAERTRTFNREKDGVRADAAKLVEKRPPYVAESALVHGIDADGSPTTVKLNRAQIERDYGKGTVGQLLRGITSEDGIPLEVAAEKFGFKSAAELWEAMHRKNFVPRKQAVDDMTDQIMQGRHPEMSSDALHDAAMRAVHSNSAHADVLSRESAALALKANRTPMAREQFKAIAEGVINDQNHRDVNHDSYVRAERVEHNKAADALLQNPPDYTAAFLHNQKAELAHACYRAAQEAEDVIADTAALMKKAQKTSERQKLGRAGGFLVTGKNGERLIAPTAAQAADLAKEYEGTTETFLQAMDRMTEMWGDRPTRYDMDYGAVHDLYREAATIMHQAREAHELLIEGKREALSETVADLTDSQREAAKGGIVAVPRTKGTGYQFQTWLRQFDAGQRTISSICRSLDGEKTGGYHWNTINRPMNDAANDETVRKIANMTETHEAITVWGKRGIKGSIFVPAVGEHLDLQTRIGVMLNTGTKRNLERAMTGDQWSREQVNAIVATLDHKDIQLVKTIWANLDKKWPEISAVHQRINGIPPEKEPSIPVQTAFGTIDGGYYPILYDKDVGARAMELSLQKDHSPITGSPAAGFGISRVESTGLKLQYGFSALFRHNDDTAHFISHAELAQNLNKIINNKGFAQSVVDRFGMPTYQAVTERIKNVLEGPRGPQNAFERGVRYVRQRTGLATMGFNLMTFISHGFGVFQNMERVGSANYVAAESQILSDPQSALTGYAFIKGKSTMMANMKFNATPETAERIRQGAVGGALSTVQDHALDLLHAALFHINSATWMAEYKTRMAETPKDEPRAIALADQAVRDTQGTGQTVDKTQFQDKNEFVKVMSQYLSFFTRTYQALRPGVVNAWLKDPQSIANLAKSFAMLVVLPATTEALFRQAVRPSPDNDNSPKFWLEKLGAANAEYLASTVFLGRELAGAFEGHGAQDPAAMRSMTSVTGTVKDFGHLLTNPDTSGAGKAARTAFLLAGQMFGLPVTQIDHLIQGILYDTQQGTPDPRAPLFGPPPKH